MIGTSQLITEWHNTVSHEILSSVRGRLSEEDWLMNTLDDVAKLHPFISGTNGYLLSLSD